MKQKKQMPPKKPPPASAPHKDAGPGEPGNFHDEHERERQEREREASARIAADADAQKRADAEATSARAAEAEAGDHADAQFNAWRGTLTVALAEGGFPDHQPDAAAAREAFDDGASAVEFAAGVCLRLRTLKEHSGNGQ